MNSKFKLTRVVCIAIGILLAVEAVGRLVAVGQNVMAGSFNLSSMGRSLLWLLVYIVATYDFLTEDRIAQIMGRLEAAAKVRFDNRKWTTTAYYRSLTAWRPASRR